MRESEQFRLYGCNRCVISQRVRLLSTDEKFSGVLRIGDECSAYCSVCTMYEMILAEIKSSLLYELFSNCLARAV